MPAHRRGKSIRVLREIFSGLPGRHERTTLSVPENNSKKTPDQIYTGLENPRALNSFGHSLLGLLFWFGWISWGVYNWWFVDRNLLDFYIGATVWIFTFVFTVIGVPLVRQVARNQQRR